MMKVKFSCKECGIVKAEVEVPARSRALDIAFWIKSVVVVYIAAAHKKASPLCTARSITDLMIPYDEKQEFIGQEKKEG